MRVALLSFNARAGDAIGNLVAENERSLYDPRELFPIPISHVHIGVASTTGFYLDQNFIRCGTRPFDVLDR